MTKFETFITKALKIYKKKNADYTGDHGEFYNFELTATIADTTVELVFLNHIANKIARINALKAGNDPQNESLQDSREDLAIYCILYASYFQ